MFYLNRSIPNELPQEVVADIDVSRPARTKGVVG